MREKWEQTFKSAFTAASTASAALRLARECRDRAQDQRSSGSLKVEVFRGADQEHVHPTGHHSSHTAHYQAIVGRISKTLALWLQTAQINLPLWSIWTFVGLSHLAMSPILSIFFDWISCPALTLITTINPHQSIFNSIFYLCASCSGHATCLICMISMIPLLAAIHGQVPLPYSHFHFHTLSIIVVKLKKAPLHSLWNFK